MFLVGAGRVCEEGTRNGAYRAPAAQMGRPRLESGKRSALWNWTQCVELSALTLCFSEMRSSLLSCGFLVRK